MLSQAPSHMCVMSAHVKIGANGLLQNFNITSIQATLTHMQNHTSINTQQTKQPKHTHATNQHKYVHYVTT